MSTTSRRKYEKTAQGKERRRKYDISQNGHANKVKQQQKYNASPKKKAAAKTLPPNSKREGGNAQGGQ